MENRLETRDKGLGTTPYGREEQGRARRGFFMPGSAVVRFRRAVAEVLEVEEGRQDQAHSNQHQIEHGILIHLPFLLYNDRVNDNTDSDQDQCQNETSRQSDPGDRLLGEYSKYEYCQTQFRRIVEELRQVVPSVLAHGRDFIKSVGTCQ